MKKIILNENRLSVLLEYAGYVNIFERLVDYVANKIFQAAKQNIIDNGIDIYDGFNIIYKEYIRIMNTPNYIPMDNIIIQSYELSELIPSNIRIKTIVFYPSINETCFNVTNSVYNEKAKIFTIASFRINPSLCFKDDNKMSSLKIALQHEFTHLYEYLKRYSNGGYKHGMNDFNNKYYNFHDRNKNIVAKLSYYLNPSEINAKISEFYRELLDISKNIEMDVKFCYDILDKTNVGVLIKDLIKIKNDFEKNPDLTYQIMMWLIKNPTHLDMFPKVRNNSPKTMQKRLIRMMDYKINYLYKKIDKIIKKFMENYNNQNMT